jgi:folate-dependent phosphoribosylglycinamide formyltransferase PurN
MQDRRSSEAGLMTAGPADNTALDRSIRVVVFTSGPALEDGLRELLCQLESHADTALMGVICESNGTTLADAWRDLRRRRGVLAPVLFALETARRARRWLRPARQRQLGTVLNRIEGRVHVVADMHADPVLEEIRALAPDLGLSYGSPILRPALFEIPSRGTLGIHHGKLPEYRGKKTPFWAIYSGEAYAGVTIQRVNPRLDAGEIVCEGEIRVGRRTLGAVWRRLEALGVTLYLQAILAVRDGCADFEPPRGEEGPLYRDPTPRDIAIFWLRWLLRLARGGPRETAS